MTSILRAAPPGPTNFQSDEDRLFIRSVGRAMSVLSAFHHASGPMSLSEIAAIAEIDRSAAQRLVHTMTKLGYIRRSADDRGYLPGFRLLDHTLDMLRLDPIVQIATPVLLELRKTTRERVDLSLFDETRLIYAFRIQSKRETFYATLVGHSVPAASTAGGRAALSALTDAEVHDILTRTELKPYTNTTETNPDKILNAIRQAREDGFALVVDEFVRGEVAIGVPVTGRDGRPLGAIHVAGSRSEWNPQDFVDQNTPVALEAARAINGSL